MSTVSSTGQPARSRFTSARNRSAWSSVQGISLGSRAVYFLPEKVLVVDGAETRHVPYPDLEVEAGHVLCREGRSGREFFVIVEGEVEVTRKGKPVKRSGGDEFFGEIALLEDIPRTATVTAKTPVRLFVLSSRDFRRLVQSSPSVESKVMRSLARRLLELSGDPALG